MRCQKCEKPSTFHITELTGSEPQELHLCEDHAREYLSHPDSDGDSSTALSGSLAQHLKVGQTAEEISRIDQQSCPMCGITFYEFRNQGRLGCPHDYSCFSEELEPLLVNIHGALEHKGKRPKNADTVKSNLTDLIRLRRELKEAIGKEDYEMASQLRDQIRALEHGET